MTEAPKEFLGFPVVVNPTLGDDRLAGITFGEEWGPWTCFNCGWLGWGTPAVIGRVVLFPDLPEGHPQRISMKAFERAECFDAIKRKGWATVPPTGAGS